MINIDLPKEQPYLYDEFMDIIQNFGFVYSHEIDGDKVYEKTCDEHSISLVICADLSGANIYVDDDCYNYPLG
jgi:hypothetical protein